MRCSARARHATIGTKTEKRSSKSFFAGIRVLDPRADDTLIIQPGEQISTVKFASTVKPMCNGNLGNGFLTSHSPFARFTKRVAQRRKCCVDLEFDLDKLDKLDKLSGGNNCLTAANRRGIAVNLPTCGLKLCEDNWNQTLTLPLSTQHGKQEHHSSAIEYTLTPRIRAGHAQWHNYQLPAVKVKVAASAGKKTDACSLSASSSAVDPFGAQVTSRNLTLDVAKSVKQPMGVFTLFKKTAGGNDLEVQVQMRSCNLRRQCLCALAVRSKTLAVYFDR